MNGPTFSGRNVLVIGERLAPVAQEALGQARFEIAAADRLDILGSVHGAMELVLVDAEAADPMALVGAISALASRPSAPAVLLAGSHLPASVVRALMKLAHSDVLDPPFTSVELARSAAALLAQAQTHAQPANASCWAVVGSVGGCGATTIAVEVASRLAGRAGQGQRVALVDLNLADGAASAYLGAAANMHLADASASPERIDQALLDAFSLRVGGGFDLFACPRDPHGFAKVAPTAVLRLLEVACQAYDWIMVDLPRGRQPWTMDLLAGSDQILVVSELTVPALLAARALSGEIETELPERAHPRIILNRMASRMFGPAPSRSEAEKALGRNVDGVITSDWEAAACSANLGGPISQHRPRSKIVKDISVIVEGLIAGSGGPTRKAA